MRLITDWINCFRKNYQMEATMKLILGCLIMSFSFIAYAENEADCYRRSSFDYIFTEKNSDGQKISKKNVNKIIALRNKASKLAKKVNAIDVSDEDRLHSTGNSIEADALNAEIVAICAQIEELAN